ncbi:O-antigen ligase family protein [Rhizobium sp. FY34]|uniref:O-antigen ligase family protein n=1 Tax=Rhizobium sp. FY34 TaxID=2562309 RepID=UPI0014857B5C|nr:O-antigen ligase family protein [Rhizobium sp. FY34]
MIFPVLWAVTASAVIVESDVYRYSCIIFVIFTLTREMPLVRSISRDWLALLCYGWSLYAFSRFLIGLLVYGEKGASEWLYIFPLLFPVLGAALYATRRHILAAATILLIASLGALLLTLNYQTTADGMRAAPLFHHNPIHAAIGCCMILITAIFWLIFGFESGLFSRRKWSCAPFGVAVILLSLIGVLGSQSKGAWLALCATLGFMILLAFFQYAGRNRLYFILIVSALVLVVTTLVATYVREIAGTTVSAGSQLSSQAVTGQNIMGAMQHAINDPATPFAMKERLMLWSNSFELISAEPWFGWGNLWLREWRKTTYADIGYTLMHNGYLEIMVRHGLFGLLFLATFIAASIWRISQACRSGVIAPSLAAYLYCISFFFFCTILTNSNNRLALGESFMCLAAAAVFAITLAMQASTPHAKPATHPAVSG